MLRVGYKGMVAFSLKLQNIPQLETDCTQINYIIWIYSSVFFTITIIIIIVITIIIMIIVIVIFVIIIIIIIC